MSDSLDPLGYIPSESSVPGIFQARILKHVAISYSRGSSQTSDRTGVSCIGRLDSLPLEPPGKPSVNFGVPERRDREVI